MNDEFRPDVAAPPAMPRVLGRSSPSRIGPKPEKLTKAETEVLTDEKRSLIEQIDSSRIP